MVVQHNLTAMNSNRMLGLTKSTQAKSTEKLSSGYKINRAADDAAGLSISEKMRKQIRGLTQASTNAQDGISAVQTAEGALNEVQDMLQRMNELAVKAANGTNSTDDRNYIQDEIDQLVTEIDRVAETTKFNETYLLKGDKDGGNKDKYEYTKNIATLKTTLYTEAGDAVSAGSFFDKIDSTKNYYTDAPGVKLAGEAIDDTNSSNYLETVAVVGSAANYYTLGSDGYTQVEAGTELVDSETYYTGEYDPDKAIQTLTSVASGAISEEANKIKSGEEVYDSTGVQVTADTITGDISNYYVNVEGVSYMRDDEPVNLEDYKASSPTSQLTDKDGNEIAANGLYRFFDEDGNYQGGLYLNNSEVAKTDTATIDAYVSKGEYEIGALSLKLHVGADATDNNQITIELDSMSSERLGVNGLKVDGKDDTNARNAIETIKEALQKVSTQRSALGAVQNRLEHTIANLDNVVENTTSAESTIRDTDMATEMVKYSNNNILAQAGQAMLAQANQSNQGVLSLLG